MYIPQLSLLEHDKAIDKKIEIYDIASNSLYKFNLINPPHS